MSGAPQTEKSGVVRASRSLRKEAEKSAGATGAGSSGRNLHEGPLEACFVPRKLRCCRGGDRRAGLRDRVGACQAGE